MTSDAASKFSERDYGRRKEPHHIIGTARTAHFWRWVCTLWLAVSATILFSWGNASGQPIEIVPNAVMLTNALQANHLASGQESVCCSIRIEGIIEWINKARDQLILQDNSGGVAVRIDLHSQLLIQTGQKVLLKAICLAGRGEIICTGLVDNDGLHESVEASGTVFLSSGLHPLCVECFNSLGKFALDVDWAGPGISRQPISSGSLFRTETNIQGGTNRLTQGLDYRCYEGDWEELPDFSLLPVLRRGVVDTFDIGVRTRDDNVGLVFEGYVKVPLDGIYRFWTKSADGSKLFIGAPPNRLNILGMAKVLPPNQVVRLVVGQPVSTDHNSQWGTLEGVVTFVSESPGSLYLELNSNTGRTRLEIAGEVADLPNYLLGCQIEATGICKVALSIDEQPGFSLLVPSLKQITILEMAPAYWTDYPVVSIGSVEESDLREITHGLVHIIGTVCSNLPRKIVVVEDKTGRIAVQTDQSPPRIGEKVEALGLRSYEGTNAILENGFYRKVSPDAVGDSTLPLLTQALEVKRLERAEAQRGYPVKIRGVITARIGGGFAIQDSTWSVLIRFNYPQPDKLTKVGGFWEIQGKTAMDFAPCIEVDSAVRLGAGILPEPLRPTWDELINGSLDTQYIEIQGVVTATGTNSLMLITREGKMNVRLVDFDPQALGGLEGALVRIRGVNSPGRDENLQVIVANLSLLNASINVDEPAPLQPFDIPLKRVLDLLSFDPRANALQRVRIAGQVVHERHGEYFLMDGASGLRFRPQTPIEVQNGDLVEVVGFPDVSGSSPALREALVRKTGKAILPTARHLSGNTLMSSKPDATRVSIEARLVNSTVNVSEEALELQTGNRNFVARLEKKYGLLPDITPGSLLELTGVYAGQRGDWLSSRDVDSFELLLNCPSDVGVMARPSWWTVQHAFIVLGGMAFAIFSALIWIIQLRRQLDKRTVRLAAEIQCREQAEHQRALEEERSRIARDLHDDLGATLTQIRFLSAVKSSDLLVPEATRKQLKQVSEKSRQTVSSLDEIVWAINPANDSVRSLASYLRHTAAELFHTASVNCRFDVDKTLPVMPLTSEARHNLYLSVREALNNSAKHSHATELWLRIHWQEQTLQIIIEDNGCGFTNSQAAAGRHGLVNMQQRMEKIGGRFEYDALPGSGTTCRLYLPFE